MNKIIAVVMLIYLVSCSEKYGFIYDEQSKKPLEGVTVTDVNDSSKIYITKKDGMFSFSDCNNLIIEKSGKYFGPWGGFGKRQCQGFTAIYN